MLLSAAGTLRAQPTPSPAPTPPPRPPEELDFGSLSLAVGSGARALGMGGAFLARPDDATAASWNPAGLSYLRSPEVSLVGAFSTQDAISTQAATPEAPQLRVVEHTRGRAPDFLSLSLPVASGSLQFSYQRVIPYSGDRTIDETEDTQRRFVIDTSGGFDVLALSGGFKLDPALRVGITVNRWMNGFNQHRERLTRRPSVQEVDFDISGWSVNLGVILHAGSSLNLGFVARTPMSGHVRLTRSRTDTFETADGSVVTTQNSHISDDVGLELPAALGFGASWRASSPLTISGDYTRTYWSRSVITNYFFLPLTPDNAVNAPEPVVFPSLSFPSVFAAEQSDTQELRLGIEYVVISGRLKLPLRAGYVHERQYRLEPDGTGTALDGLAAGAGLVLGPVLLDAAYVHQWGDAASSGTTRSVRLHRVLVSVIYRHGSGN